jgi:UDP-2-acetamido-3-amino-2,3-dideoxy-glucuronate N-acetyltransferase
MTYFAHETAVIDPGAKIGSETKIWHFSHIMPKAIIGSHCTIGQNVFISNGCVVGNSVKIQNNVSLYEGVALEDYTFCGPSVVFTNVKTPRSAFPRNSSENYAATKVKRGASIGANATVICGITLGEWSFVAAGAVVTKDVQPFSLVAGVPAKAIGWACMCGSRLKFTRGNCTCAECSRRYDLKNEKVSMTSGENV